MLPFCCSFFFKRPIFLGDISTGQKALNVILFIWAFIESVMVSATNFLNRYTRDYRYVVKVLKKEKKILKVLVFHRNPPKSDCNFGFCVGENTLQRWSASRFRENMAAGRFFPHAPS